MYACPGPFRPLTLPLAAMAFGLASAAGAGSVLPGFAPEEAGIAAASVIGSSGAVPTLSSDFLSGPVEGLMDGIAPPALFGPLDPARAVSQTTPPSPTAGGEETRRD